MKNKKARLHGKSILQILLFNVFNPLNVLFFVVAALLIASELYLYLFFLIPVLLNVVLGLYLDLRHRKEIASGDLSDLDFKVKGNKRPHSVMEKTIYLIMLLCIASLAILLSIDLLIRFSYGRITTDNQPLLNIMMVAGFYISLVPASILLLYTFSRLLSFERLNKEGIKVKDNFAIERLANIDVACLDMNCVKIGETMKMKAIDPMGAMSIDQISQVLSNILHATKDDNDVVRTIKASLNFKSTASASASLPYSRENNYFGASFGSKGTYILGEISSLKLLNHLVDYRAEEYMKKGFVVLCLGHSVKPITSYKFDEVLEPVALLVFENNIRSGITDTIKYFKEQGKEIVMFSNEDDVLLSEHAKSLGVPDAEKHISLMHKNDEEVRVLATKYTIFGHATPKQKQIIIQTLQVEKKRVLVIGNKAEDVLAMRVADVSTSFVDSDYEARAFSHIVLKSAELLKLRLVEAHGRLITSNTKKIASLYLSKALASVLILSIMIVSMMANKSLDYPLFVIHGYFLEFACIGIGASLIVCDGKEDGYSEKPIRGILLDTIPAAIVEVVIVAIYFGLYISRNMGTLKYLDFSFNVYTGPLNVPENTTVGLLQVITMIVVSLSALNVSKVFQVLKPVKKSRWLIVFASILFTGMILGIEVYLSLTSKGEAILLQLAFNYLSKMQWAVIALVSILSVASYLLLSKIIEVIRDLTIKDEEVPEVKENEIKD